MTREESRAYYARKNRVKKTRDELIEEAKTIDKAKSKERKTLTKKEKADAEYKAMLEYKPEVKEEKAEIETYNEDEWDVKIGDPIEYFDADLSYELTGYRPITKDRGLDFDYHAFTLAAEHYNEFGRYTDYLEETFLWRQHWTEEIRRCREGMVVGKYRLTGENYFWLNYYRLKSPIKGDGFQRRIESFPAFVNKLYEYFHYIELCRKTNHDGLVFKSRGIGASEIAASNAAYAYTFIEGSFNIVTAPTEDETYKTLSKVWQEFDFLNEHTENAFSNPRLKIDTKMMKKASMINENHNEVGWGSVVLGIALSQPDAIRGDRVDNIYYEEAGNQLYLVESYTRSRALVEILGTRVGFRWTFGTSGSRGPQLAGLKKMFYNPKSYMVLPYKNKYTRTGKIEYTGYFIPSFSMWIGLPGNLGFDERGIVDEERAKKFYENIWATMDDKQALLNDKAEFCFTPEDAFQLEGSGVFDTEKLAEQQVNIEQKLIELPRAAKLIWPYSKELGGVDRNAIPTVEFGENGKIMISELPIKDDKGFVPNNLYCLGIDSIDLERVTGTGQNDLSKFGAVVYRRQFGLKPPKIVAIYKDRPNNVDEAYDNALKLAELYNAKVLFEATRVGIFKHFLKLGKTGYFLRRPKSTLSTAKQNVLQYGCPATQAIIEHYIELIKLYVFDYYDLIDFLEVIDELTRWSYENKGKFDLTVAFGMALLADEDLLGKNPKVEHAHDVMPNFGYYKNEYGQKVFGLIKQTEQSAVKYGWFKETGQRPY